MEKNELEARRVRRRVEQKVRRFAADHDLLPAGSRVLVAVSGGPDSTALLFALEQLSHRGGFGLAVAHFDHGLRGRDVAEHEEGFVRELALSLGLPFYEGSADVRARARERKLSLEMAARDERYAFLVEAAHEAECTLVATGHTASDQAETVLMHVIRGAGLEGLSGIDPKSSWPFRGGRGLQLVRPLLRVTRQETIGYCGAHGVKPMEDESNRSLEFRRNRIRHELMPLLETFNPRVEEALVRLADAARIDVKYLEAESINGIANESPGQSVRYTWERRVARDDALRRHGLRLALRLLLDDGQGFTERHFLAMDRLVSEGSTGDRLNLPRGVVADRGRNSVKLSIGEVGLPPLPDGIATLPVPGEARFGGIVVRSALGPPARGGVASVEVDAAAASASLCLRRRRNGDRFQPLGMKGTKKLQDFFIDERVPSDQRDSVPIFENERGIIWVGGMRIAEWAKPRPGMSTVHLSYEAISSRRT